MGKETMVRKIVEAMTIDEKIALCSGKDFWHTKGFASYAIPSIRMSDGPHGLRKQKDSGDMLGIQDSLPATCFPTAVTSGASWNRKLMEEIGEAIGEEAKEEGVPIVLGPGMNIKRNPLCGRNFEYFSEDPYLTGEMGASYITGMQKTGVGASMKHFAVNSQEYKRFSSDSQLDERTLREIYLTGFERAVKQAKPKTVMCAYPKINGTYCSDNKYLLTDILRKEWGFQGMVVTDWGAMNDRVESFLAGCDLSMPGGSAFGEKDALRAVREGRLPETVLDTCAERVLTMVLEANKIIQQKSPFACDKDDHHRLAERAAIEGAVLLKNNGGILPVAENKRIAIIGHMAEEIRYQGTGSSHINPTKLVQVTDVFEHSIYLEGCDAEGNITSEGLKQVEETAAKADLAIVFAGLPESCESEGFDRENMNLPQGHNQMIESAARGNTNTIVVLMGGSVMLLPWFDKVKAILYMGLCGQAGGQAVADIITGKASPGGRLTETWPLKEEDVPSYGYYAGNRKNAQYREGIYVGYRYYEKAEIPVRFPFGYGLSYTTFSYADMKVRELSEEESLTDKTFGRNRYRVTATIINTGNTAGTEVVQLYIGAAEKGIYRPRKELKGFEKVFLQPGENREVTFILDDRSFAVYLDGWKIPDGRYQIMLGSSLTDIRLTREVIIDKECTIKKKQGNILVVDSNSTIPLWQRGSWYEMPAGQPAKEEWEKLMGKRMEEEPQLQKGNFDINHTLIELKDFTLIARIMVSAIEKNIAKGMGIKKNENNPEFRMAVTSSADCSMRGMVISSCGQFPAKLAEIIVRFANGCLKSKEK